MNDPERVSFGGVAPIEKGTSVVMLVDNISDPKEAFSIEDAGRGIKYSSRDPATLRVLEAAPEANEGYVTAIVNQSEVFSRNVTQIAVSNIAAYSGTKVEIIPGQRVAAERPKTQRLKKDAVRPDPRRTNSGNRVLRS